MLIRAHYLRRSESPTVTRSLYSALDELKLSHLWVLYPGQHAYPVHDQITVWPLQDLEHLPSHLT